VTPRLGERSKVNGQGESALRDQGRVPEGTRQKEGEMLHKLQERLADVLASLPKREEGQALVEYALLLSLIAIVSIGILTTLGDNVSKIFSTISHKL
jgi:pilus assembly protein Flp/PilA